MSEDLFDELLSDADDASRFLALLGEGMPDAVLRLARADGAWLPAEAPLPPDAEELRRHAGESAGGAALQECPDGIHCALLVPRFAATLLALFPRPFGKRFRLPDGLIAWLAARAEAALAATDQEGLRVKNDQLTREVEVLTRHHHQLMEDNHRQFLLTQEREQEYARILEREVASRTAELHRTNAQLVEAAEAKSTFLATMSHELRTPMNSIIGLSALALDLDLSAKARDYVQTVNSSARGLLRILNDVLDFSKIEAGKLTLETIEFQPVTVIEEQMKLVAPAAAAKGLDLFAVIAPGIPATLLGDPLRLGQVLANLLNNAIKFTDTGGIIVRARCLELRPTVAVIAFSVTDTGIGIEPDAIPSLFQSFTQADGSISRRFGGTGLGLAICGRIVRLLGGEISVQGAPAAGCTFRFTAEFGLVSGTESTASPLPRLPPGASCLVLSDSAVARTALSETLSLLGLAVQAAQPGSESAGPTATPLPDLVLWDGGGAAPGTRNDAPPKAPPFSPAVPVIALTDGENCPREAAPRRITLPRTARTAALAEAIVRLLAPEKSREEPAPSRMRRQPGESATLLLADPDTPTREFLASLLSSLGHAVTVAGDAVEIREALQHGNPVALILDPLACGPETAAVAEVLRKRCLPCILLVHRGEAPPPAFATQVTAMLTRPVSPQDLFAAVDGILPTPRGPAANTPPAREPPPAGESRPVLPAGAETLFGELDALLGKNDLEAEGILPRLRELIAGHGGKPLADLEKHLRDYDFKAARESLWRLAASLGIPCADSTPTQPGD